MNPPTVFAIEDTRIDVAGVMRCCLETVAREHTGLVQIGSTSKCPHCGTAFTLIEADLHPTWTPDWQLKERNASPRPHDSP